MKKLCVLSAASIAAFMLYAQDKMNIYIGNSSESISIEDIENIKFKDGVMTISGKETKSIDVPAIEYADFTLDEAKSDTVFVTFNNESVSVNDYTWDKVSYTANGANISFSSSQNEKGIVYYLSGSSSNGSFTITPDRAFTLVMDNLSLSSSQTSPIVINLGNDGDSYATNIELVGKSELSDASSSSYKGCIYAKSKLKFGELGANGELSISGNTKHAINSSKKTEIYAGTINITSAVSDGLNSDGLKMYGGKLNISGVSGDGVDASESIVIENGEFVFNSNADDVKALKCDSALTITGGKVDISMTGAAAKGLKTSYNDVIISGGEVVMNINGTSIIADGDTSYSAGIKTDAGVQILSGNIDITLGSNAIASKGITADKDVTVDGAILKITNNGGYYSGTTTTTSTGNQNFGGRPGSSTTTTTTTTYTEGRCIKGYNVYLTSGEITLITTNGAKNVKAESDLCIGTKNGDNSALVINATTGGTLVSSSSSSSSSNRPGGMGGGGMEDGNSISYAGNLKAFVGNNIIVNSGTITINAKDDAFHSNGNLTINGGNITIDSTDDALHAESNLTFNGGYIRIKSCYEGFEGNNITVNGGESLVTSSDDSWNAKTSLTFNGGVHMANAASGDHDCLDSNGTFTITGGVVIASGNETLDTDGAQSQTGGALLLLEPSGGGMGGGMMPGGSSQVLSNPQIEYSNSISQGNVITISSGSDVKLSVKLLAGASAAKFYCPDASGWNLNVSTTSSVTLNQLENNVYQSIIK